jgi:hypothetical protein
LSPRSCMVLALMLGPFVINFCIRCEVGIQDHCFVVAI